VAEYLLYHHERYDGQGYPAKKQGQDIPLVSRILCVADVFEATTAHRVYRPAMSLEEALAIMAAGRGTFFDPVVLDAFYAYLKKHDPAAAMIIGKLTAGAA
jgi:HD-GYP domain-containing protein (c-di-GMP phosphodiesterase class II)